MYLFMVHSYTLQHLLKIRWILTYLIYQILSFK